MPNNYNTAFKIGESVKIARGLYRGWRGKVIGYSPHSNVGMGKDNEHRGTEFPFGLYTVKIGFFKSVYAFEAQLERRN